MIGFEIFLAIGMFTAIVLGLVAIILVAAPSWCRVET